MSLETIITGIAKIITPYHDRLFIDRDQLPQESETGLDISVRRDKAPTGTIISMGKRCTINAKRVMFGRSAGTEITINGQPILVLREQDCFLDLDNMLPFHDKVLIRPDPAMQEIRGIIIPDNLNEQPQSGTVISVGPKCEETAPRQHVLFGKFAGLEITLDKETFLIIRECDLFAEL